MKTYIRGVTGLEWLSLATELLIIYRRYRSWIEYRKAGPVVESPERFAYQMMRRGLETMTWLDTDIYPDQ